MSTHLSNNAESAQDDRTDDDQRMYPAEDAYGPRRSTPAWQRIDPDLSGGYVEVHLALDCNHPDYPFDEVSST